MVFSSAHILNVVMSAFITVAVIVFSLSPFLPFVRSFVHSFVRSFFLSGGYKSQWPMQGSNRQP